MRQFDVVEFVKSQEGLFLPAVSDKSIVWEKESQFVIQLLQGNKYLADLARDNPTAAQNAIINVAAIGVTLNPAAKLAYLVPRKKAICLDISYMGMLHIAQQSGCILWGQSKIVREKDVYRSNGIDKAPTHDYPAFAKPDTRGPIVGVYCVAKTIDGSYLTEEMSIDEVYEIRDKSESWISHMKDKSKQTPWKTFESEMIKKTVIKRAQKYWPKSPRLDMAIDCLNADGGEGIDFSGQKSRSEKIINPIDAIKASLSKRNAGEADFFGWAQKVVKREVVKFEDLTDAELQAFARQLEAVK